MEIIMEIFAKPLKISSFQANHNPFSRGRTKIVQMPIFCDIYYKNLLSGQTLNNYDTFRMIAIS